MIVLLEKSVVILNQTDEESLSKTIRDRQDRPGLLVLLRNCDVDQKAFAKEKNID